MYTRRMGSSLISGPLYEIKLISLLYFRAFRDNTIEDFQLATNVDCMGYFDDICFVAKVKGFHKPVAVFIQAKHRERMRISYHVNLKELFGSYLKIVHQFDPTNKVPFLKGKFDETECVFVVYTNATIHGTATGDDSDSKPFPAKLNDLIATGGTVKQPNNQQEDINVLCEVLMKEQMVSLAERIADHITENVDFKTLLNNDIVQQFHVILAREVFDVSDILPDGHREATFRPDFFDTKEEYLIIFKDTLFKEIIKRGKIKFADINNSLFQLFADPTNAGRGGHHAVELAEREILLNHQFKVPAAFGNKDLTIRGSDSKIEKRLNYLSSKISQMLGECEPSKIVTIDESLENGFLRLNGGITGAIGNLFVLDDDNSKLMKITDNLEQLGALAKELYMQLRIAIHNLHEYKFYFKLNKCPRLSFECIDNEENLARDFLNRLLLYSNQASEYEVEKILKDEIEDYQSCQAEYFQAKTDAIFSRYFDLIQKWWSQRHEAPYLTRKLNLFLKSINDNIRDPLISSINLICKSKVKKYGYTFQEDVVRYLNLQDQYMRTVIIAENSLLTVAKVMQHLKNKEHAVLDFEHIDNLPERDRYSLCMELEKTNENKVLILIYDENNNINDITSLEMIADAVRCKKIIVVTNQMTFKVLEKYFPKVEKILHDKKLSLIDLSETSQMRVFETAIAIFSGVEIRLDQLLRDCPKPAS